VPAEVEPHLATVARETLADKVTRGSPSGDSGPSATVELSGGSVTITLRGLQGGPRVE